MFDTAEQQKELWNIAELFTSVKGLILFCEEIYPGNQTNPQVLLELRNSLDHLIRSIIRELKPEKSDDNKYIKTNLNIIARILNFHFFFSFFFFWIVRLNT